MDPIKLDFPVTAGNQSYDEIPAPRRVKVKDLLTIRDAKDHKEEEIFLLAHICGVPREVILELDQVDYEKLQERLKGFRRAQPEKGVMVIEDVTLPHDVVRLCVLALARFTGWSLTEIADMEVSELTAWLESAKSLQEQAKTG